MRGELMQIRSGASESFCTRLREHCAANEIELPTYVTRQLNAITALTTEISAADCELKEFARKNEYCVRLMTVPGVGPVTSVRFLAAVDQVNAPVAAVD